jgi:uncharacterized membrane protein
VLFRGRWTDERVELWVGGLLRSGVLFAAAVAFAGAVAFLYHYGAMHVDHSTFTGVPAGLNEVTGVINGAIHLRSRWIVQLGLLLLIATPIARVAMSMVAFALQHDILYVFVTAIVLGLLLFGLFGAGAA